jgi:flagella basal body P-ring formation protein FlgA
MISLYLVVLTTGSGTVMAEALQSHQSIRDTAESFISTEVQRSYGRMPEAKAGRLDSRLRLGACDEPLEGFLPAGGHTLGNATVGVRCHGTKPWSLYVPVKVSIFDTVVVAARPLSRNHIIDDEDLNLAERNIAELRSGYITDTSQLIGKQSARSISIGAAITASMVKDPLQIKRGQRISLVTGAGGLDVRMAGEAMSDGAAGDRIQVRNLSSKRVVEGTVVSPMIVQVDM